ncbi:MAG: sensor histidine kinase [Clostridia bacterium]|nr:sensor histidine kinase [Clostridia bacterium]
MKLKSIRVQILAIMLLCYLVPTLLLGEYMGGVFFTDLKEKTEAALTSGAEHALTLTRQNAARVITLAKDATYDAELTNAYASYASGAVGSAEFLRLSRGYLERKYGREEAFTFAVFFPLSEPTLPIYNRAGYERATRYQQSAHARVLELGGGLDTRCLFIREGEDTYLIRNLYNLRMERFGMLVLGIDMETLLVPMRELEAAWDAEIDVRLGEAGGEGIDWDGVLPGLSDAGGGDEITYASVTGDRDYALRMRMTVSKHRVYGEMEAFRRMMAYLFLMLVPVMALILWYVNRRIVRPIAILSSASRRIEAGEWGITVPMHGGDELGDLGRAFSGMSMKIANLIDKTYKEEIALRDARIQAMQSRLNPHFINNALESINWQARIEGSETISAMVESLSVLLNASMARGDKRMAPLSEEIGVAKAYFYFIRQRFGERLDVVQEIEGDVLDAVVPLLTIQPLLENAVEHGIAPAGGGAIGLSCAMEDGMLVIRVSNGGKPLSEADSENMRAAIRGDTRGGEHLGLANIASRLALIYGGRARIQAEASAQGETVVTLRIPHGKDA